MTDCIFCKIVNREIPADIIYEDDHTLAFVDIKPVNRGHSLVIPKQHSTDLLEAKEQDLIALTKTVQKVATAVKKALGASGINISANNGAAAGQVVFHTHYHIIPRFAADGLTPWPHHDSEPKTRQELAEEIKKHI
jgi:histidine triad (HIT) family protein